jgi:3-oxoacyl-[acyl-carrier protein] reductase
MDLKIKGKWALVCGASKGLGLGCAKSLVQEGVNVVIVARGAEALGEAVALLKSIGSAQHVIGVAADVTTVEGREAVWSVSAGPGKDYDIVITNAGGPPPGDFKDWGRDTWIKAIDANMLTPIELIKSTIDGMAQRGYGRIINITSGAVKAPIEILGLSNGARSGLTGFVAGIARASKYVSKNVTINNLLPGAYDTDRLKVTMSGAAQKSGQSIEDVANARRKTIPAQRFGHPDEFGDTCAFLCSQSAGYITGQNILTDGGAYPGTY